MSLEVDSAGLPYEVSPETLASIRAWRRSAIRPDLFVMAPMREVGERELVEELAEASYAAQGFRDSRERHFISRAFPHKGSEHTYARFSDQPHDVSEITDGFYGVDCVDLTEWVGRSLSREGSDWPRLLTHVSEHPETDFVFLAYTEDEQAVSKLMRSLSSNCGIAVELVKLFQPSAARLAAEFVSQGPESFGSCAEYIQERYEEMAELGWHVSLASARASALSALHETSIVGDAREAVRAVFDRSAAAERSAHRTFKVGFEGGM